MSIRGLISRILFLLICSKYSLGRFEPRIYSSDSMSFSLTYIFYMTGAFSRHMRISLASQMTNILSPTYAYLDMKETSVNLLWLRNTSPVDTNGQSTKSATWFDSRDIIFEQGSSDFENYFTSWMQFRFRCSFYSFGQTSLGTLTIWLSEIESSITLSKGFLKIYPTSTIWHILSWKIFTFLNARGGQVLGICPWL